MLLLHSSKQGHGESEWELKERSARRVYISGRKSLTIEEASQLILDEAREVFQHDLNLLGLNASLMHNRVSFIELFQKMKHLKLILERLLNLIMRNEKLEGFL